MAKVWRRLDNTAKVFSLEEKNNNNTFRLSVILKEQINSKILKLAITQALNLYPSYKVKMKSGLFWNYLEFNSKEPIVEKENQMPCTSIDLINNNDYLFKVTYYKNKINLDIYHVLTDGIGASIFFKKIIYNYLDIRYNLNSNENKFIKNTVSIQDEYIKNADKKLICKEHYKKAFLIKEKSNFKRNKTYHYILNLEKFKNICNKLNVSITEYLSALYIYALYNSIYDKNSKKDLIITIPIDLRKHYHVESFSNFFTCMNIEGNVSKNKKITFNKILNQVQKEFKTKLTLNKIKTYLARDVKLGTNLAIRLVPLNIKRFFIQRFNKLVNQTNTTTLSNIGSIKIKEKYKRYIDNIMVLVNAGKVQKVKCTICSFENKLTVTINSNLISNKLEKEFYNLLKKYIGNVRIESNI